MKRLVYFIIFYSLTSQMCFASLEQPLTPHSDEIFEVTIKYAKSRPITHYVGAENKVEHETAVDYVKQVYNTLKNLYAVFVSSVAKHFYFQLKSYCQAALELIRNHLDEKVKTLTVDEVIDSIKLDKNCDFCVVSFLYDLNYDVNKLLQIIFILKIDRLAEITVASLGEQLDSIFVTYFNDDNKYSYSKRTIPKLKTELSKLRDEIQKDSEIFCLPITIPLIEKNFYDTKSYNPKADFIDTIFNSNKCYVYFNLIETKFNNNDLGIEGWTCSYKLGNYEKDKGKNSLTHWAKKTMERTLDCLSTFGCIKPKTKPTYRNHAFAISKEVTLASLRKTLLVRYNHSNILKYQNIASDLMVLNGIKELVKILVEIKGAFARHSDEITIDNIHVMRSRLFITALLFEGLIGRLYEKLRYNATIYSNVTQIHDKVNSILGFLDIGKTFQVESIKSNILRELEKETAGDETKKYKYKKYRVLDPIENMYLLFSFKLSYFE